MTIPLNRCIDAGVNIYVYSMVGRDYAMMESKPELASAAASIGVHDVRCPRRTRSMAGRTMDHEQSCRGLGVEWQGGPWTTDHVGCPAGLEIDVAGQMLNHRRDCGRVDHEPRKDAQRGPRSVWQGEP